MVAEPNPTGPGSLHELAAFPGVVTRAVRAQHVGFPVRITVRRHRRWVQVVGPRLVPAPEAEVFFSCEAEAAWGEDVCPCCASHRWDAAYDDEG